MPTPPYRVGRASAGLGLFATKEFRKGEIVVAYRGQRILDEEAERRERRGARYIFEINSRWSIDGANRRNTARYVNHSCRPNVEALARKIHPICYVARRRIKSGEEITVDYGKDYFSAYIKASGCRCLKCKEKRRDRMRAWRAKKARLARKRLVARRDAARRAAARRKMYRRKVVRRRAARR